MLDFLTLGDSPTSRCKPGTIPSHATIQRSVKPAARVSNINSRPMEDGPREEGSGSAPAPRPRLPFGVRVGVFLVGWLLILVGIAGLVLPGIQGVLTLVLGAALLSLDNQLAHRGLRRLLRRWPEILHRLEGFRERTHDRLHHLFSRRGKR